MMVNDMTQLTHWKKLENPDYIGSYAFQPGEKKTVTIKDVAREIVTGPDGKREECTIIHFREDEKPLILNRTNGKAISKVLETGYIEQWLGGRIILAVEKVRAFGDMVEAVRVQKQKPEQAKAPAENCTDCGKAIETVGSYSAETIITAAKKRFGVPLCMQCAAARKIAAESTTEEANNP